MIKYYLRSLMPASKFNVLYHSEIESCNHAVMYQIYLVLSYNGDFTRVIPLSNDYTVQSLCFMLSPEDGGILLSRNVDAHNPFGEVTFDRRPVMWGR
jgi:hypothetical protein